MCLTVAWQQALALQPKLSDQRMVFQTEYGDLEMAVYPDIAPVTAPHIMELAALGGYNTVSFFRVDKGFVAQVADVAPHTRMVPMNTQQKAVADLRVPLEVTTAVKHDKRGILSMGRMEDPNSGTSSFSVLLGPAPHLDQQYTIFGEVTAGLEMLTKLEGVETFQEGIFVMPKERITILSSYVYSVSAGSHLKGGDAPGNCQRELNDLQARLDHHIRQLEMLRSRKLPS